MSAEKRGEAGRDVCRQKAKDTSKGNIYVSPEKIKTKVDDKVATKHKQSRMKDGDIHEKDTQIRADDKSRDPAVSTSEAAHREQRLSSTTSEGTIGSDTDKILTDPTDSATQDDSNSADTQSDDGEDLTKKCDDSDSSECKETEICDSDLTDGSCVSRPASLSLPKPIQYYERHKRRTRSEPQSTDDPPTGSSDVSFGSTSLKGMYMRTGEMVEFVADNLEHKIRSSRDSSSMGSRTSSMQSISSFTSASTSMTTSLSGISRSPSSLLQQSPEDIPPIDPLMLIELEMQAKSVASKVDLMMGNIRCNLHKMSAISVGCLDAYKHSVDCTCDSVDASIKSMYTLIARCEELGKTMTPIYLLAEQVKEIKRLVGLFETQMEVKS